MTWRQKALRTASAHVTAVAAVSMVVVFALGFVFLFAGPVHGSGTGRPPCTPVLFLAATGSGEFPSNNRDFAASPELNFVYQNMTDLLTTQWGADKVAASIGSRLLLYAPNRIDVLTAAVTSLNFDDPTALLGGTAGAVLGGAPGAVAGYTAVLGTELRNALAASVPAYLDSEREGVTELWAQFKFTRLNCPTTKIVLAGYSQGAMVVHDFLNQLAGTRDSAGQASIIGAVLLGDPDRVKHADVLEFGPVSYASYGVCHVPELVSLSGCSSNSRVQDVSPMFQARTVSVCNYDDPVCDTSDFFPDLAGHFLHDGSNRYFCASCARDFAGTAFTTIHGSYSHIEPAALAGKLMGRYVLAKV